MSSVFTKIINRELPAYIVYETDNSIAFLDIAPLETGQVLVVPKVEIDHLWDLEDDALQALWVDAKTVANKMRVTFDVARIGVLVEGFEVAHAHIKLLPLSRELSAKLDADPKSPSNDELAQVHAQLVI